MVGLIFGKKALRNHPAFAVTETARSVSKDVSEPEWAHTLLAEMERAGKSLYRLALAQQSGSVPYEERRRLAEAFLPLIDSLHHLAEALAAYDNGALAEGARSIAAKGETYLVALGVEAIAAKGKRFDPRLHQALEARPAAPGQEGSILEEILRGYRLGEKVLRPAQVIVAKEQE